MVMVVVEGVEADAHGTPRTVARYRGWKCERSSQQLVGERTAAKESGPEDQ